MRCLLFSEQLQNVIKPRLIEKLRYSFLILLSYVDIREAQWILSRYLRRGR